MCVCIYIYIYADTTVYLGGAVIFSLAFSLAEFFEKAMKRERESLYIYIYTHLASLGRPYRTAADSHARQREKERERDIYIYIYVIKYNII